MRRTLTTLLLLLVASSTHAGILPDPKVVINGSLGIPTNPERFTKAYVIGFGGGVGLEFALTPAVHLLANVDFTTFDLDRDDFLEAEGLPPGTPVVGGETSILYVSASLKWVILPFAVFRPYASGGAGYFRKVTDDVNVDGVITQFPTQDELGAHAGAGLDVELGPVLRVFGEVYYVVGATEMDNIGYVALRGGLTFDIVPDI